MKYLLPYNGFHHFMLITLRMAFTSLFLKIFFFLIATLIPSSASQMTKSVNDGIAVRLIHRDSQLSPFYNPSLTTFERIQSAILRSISRCNYIHSVTSPSLISDISSEIVAGNGEYLMVFSVGTPPSQVYAIADTGSELTWFKCMPCQHCNKETSRSFEPSKSSTYQKLPCDAQYCFILGMKRTYCPDNFCHYRQRYEGGLTTTGTLSSDKFRFEDADGNAVDVDLYFGCSEEASGPIMENETGIVGLNRRPLSLVSQLDYKRFAYCMVIPDSEESRSGSRLHLGSEAVIAGGQTPLLKTSDNSYYYLTLEGISVGDEKVPIPDRIFDMIEGQGGVIIDSGTSFTILRREAFDPLAEALSNAINLPMKRNYRGLELCFEGSFEDMVLQPDVTFHFYGTDVILMKETTYVQPESGVWCLGMIRSDKFLSIIGNYQQRNFYVGYDLEEEVVSFAPVDCAIF